MTLSGNVGEAVDRGFPRSPSHEFVLKGDEKKFAFLSLDPWVVKEPICHAGMKFEIKLWSNFSKLAVCLDLIGTIVLLADSKT